MKIAKKVEVQYGFCACAVVTSTDSVFPSTVAHWGAVVKGPLRSSVGGGFSPVLKLTLTRADAGIERKQE